MKSNAPVRIERTFTIPNKSPEEVYEFWRNLENLPRVMDSLQSVKVLDERRSHWVAKGPAGVPLEWDAEITNERRRPCDRVAFDARIAIDISGVVRFKRKQGQGTKVHLSIRYVTPGGAIGEAAGAPVQASAGGESRFRVARSSGSAGANHRPLLDS